MSNFYIRIESKQRFSCRKKNGYMKNKIKCKKLYMGKRKKEKRRREGKKRRRRRRKTVVKGKKGC